MEDLFGDADLDKLDPQQLETETTWAMRQEASQAEEASISKEHGPIPEDRITRLVVKATPVPIEYGIPELSIPESENINVHQQPILLKSLLSIIIIAGTVISHHRIKQV